MPPTVQQQGEDQENAKTQGAKETRKTGNPGTQGKPGKSSQRGWPKTMPPTMPRQGENQEDAKTLGSRKTRETGNTGDSWKIRKTKPERVARDHATHEATAGGKPGKRVNT